MRAAVVHAPGDLRVEAVPDSAPRPGEVVLAIGAALSCGTDAKSVARDHPSIAGYPSRLGHEFAGVVRAVGEGIVDVAPGDRVFCGNSAPCGVCRPCRRGRESLCEDLEYLLGGFAEQVLVPERIAAKNLHRVPDALDLRVAALAEPRGCVVHALDRVDVAEGDRAVVLGAGSLGLMHSRAGDPRGRRVAEGGAARPGDPAREAAGRPRGTAPAAGAGEIHRRSLARSQHRH